MIAILPADLVPNVNSEIRKVVTMPRGQVLAGLVLAIALIASIASASLAGPPDPRGQPATGAATIGLYVGLAVVALAAAVFGAVGTGAEYQYHTMPVSVLFTADRDRLAAAKFLVIGCCALAAAVAVELVALGGLFGVGRHKITVTAELFAVLGGGLLAVVCWSLIGASAGILMRSSSRAVALLLGWVVIGEPLLWLVAQGLGIPGIVTLLPVSATVGTVAVGSFPDSDFLAPTPAAVVVLLLWTIGSGAASWWSLRTRDL
ncbi:ABC transporter permease [Nocardia sp. NBC_00508]|uniref:ABC transporter permease n=1 Tax=Nocardia sp. NBC_00508 TaxID=2975992 RepID=UPI002E7FD815|nr:ABC transporter permease [Nocardia sp. NBC_00508]WUD64323.1 ABC transporter permease [Nocardia sp. NBC_00508]